ncbi:MAG: NfeD family protein [Actinomycetota bacterium]|nr:NfeD family protein [Actinomycetota bacterium]
MLRVVAAVFALLGAVVVFSLPAAAQETEFRTVVVIEVSGLLDPVEVSYIRQQLEGAIEDGAIALVLQVNSPGDAVSDDDLLGLLDDLEASSIPVVVWVGQSGAKARGGAAHLVTVADFSAISTKGRIGNFGDLPNPRAAEFVAFADRTAGVDEAIEAGLVDELAPLVGELLLIMEANGILDAISEPVEGQEGLRSLRPDVRVDFAKLSLTDQLFHTVASPAVAYLLLLIGLSLIMLDFFTGGIGVAGGVGLVCLLLSAYGLGVLDLRPWALLALIVSMLGFAIDLQTGIPRFWTAAGTVLLVVGSWFLYGSHDMSWITLASGIGLTLAFMFSGMPALIRTRYGTSTLGREWMIGKMTEAATDIDPEGLVVLDGAQWRARVNRLTPLSAGDPARIVRLEGLVLEVEPEEGGAIDYREMRGSKKDDEEPD